VQKSIISTPVTECDVISQVQFSIILSSYPKSKESVNQFQKQNSSPPAGAAGGPDMNQLNAMMQSNPELIQQIIGTIAQENPGMLQVRNLGTRQFVVQY
jgi:hypothetical protein